MAGILIDLVNQPLSLEGLIISTVTVTGTTQGTVQDFTNAMTQLGAQVHIGSVSTGITGVVVQVEECATTNGTFTAITGMITTITSGQANTTVPVSLKGQRQQRYVRANALTCSCATVTSSAVLCVTLIEQLKFTGGTSDKGGFSRSPSS